MSPQALTRQVDLELKHVPDWPGEFQGELRMLYNMVRRRSLGRRVSENRTAGDVLRYCIDSVRQRHPGAEMRFAAEFFAIGVETGESP